MKQALGWMVAVLIGLVFIMTLLDFSLSVPKGPPPSATDFQLVGVEVVTPGRERLVDVALHVSEGRITAVGRDVPQPESEALEAYRGHVVLPGLINMHTHLPNDSALDLTAHFGLLHIRYGVTSIREVGDMDGTAIRAGRRDFEEQGKLGPRVFACGPFLSGPNPRWKNAVVVNAPEEAAEIVAAIAADGFHCLKLYDGLDPARIQALVTAAAEHGLVPLGHVPYGLTFEEASIPDTQHLMGVPRPADIEAGDQVVFRINDWRKVNEARMDEVVVFSRRHALIHTPTLVATHQLLHFEDYEAARQDPVVNLLPRLYRDAVWHPEKGIRFYRGMRESRATIRDAREKKLRMVKKLHDAGVLLHLGTDAQQPFVVPGAAMHQEMRLFAEAGIPLQDIWAYATWKAGERLGVAGLGTLQPGAPADLLIFRQDPTRDLAALGSLVAIVAQGRLYRRDGLEVATGRSSEHFQGFLIDRLSVGIARRAMRRSIRGDH